MKVIKFKEQTIVYAKDQPQYLPLPVYQCKNDEGTIICCWQLTFKERLKLLFTGKIWHSVMTFYKPLQPQLLMVDKPEELIIVNKIEELDIINKGV